ncbi:MAG: hypothetical protein K6G23_05980, partial [Lachnospiraceae bacterium]|nr:hypothetical protein [Lachnospiraceae bacterium]
MANQQQSVYLNHIAEIYLYEYYIAGDQPYEVASGDRLYAHLRQGRVWMLEKDYQKALEELLSAFDLNPVCMEAISGIITCHKQLRHLQEAFEYTGKMYQYCCTRSELAAYYRNLGWYYLEIYEPDVAVACYQYSNLFEQSQQSETEIRFLEAALKKTYEKMEIEQLQRILSENEIPLKANSVTLALVYQAGKEAYEIGNRVQAHDCFCMVYDLTQD